MDAILYVSPEGSDQWSGRVSLPLQDGQDGPLRTLAGARHAVRALRAGDKAIRNVRVLIRDGVYAMRETEVFGIKDGALAGAHTSYEAYPGEHPTFTAGVPVVDWRPVDGLHVHAPVEARGRIWEADIPDGVGWFGMLYDNDLPQPRARGKGFTPTVSGHWQDEDCWRLGSRTRLHFPPGAMRVYENMPDVEIVIRPWCLWTMNILPLASVDEERGIATTEIEGSYFLTRERYHRFPDESVWVENIPEGLTGPGRWMVDTSLRKILYWPANERAPGQVTVPALRELIRVEGELREEDPEDRPVHGITFKGLHFIQGDRDRWTSQHKGVQHDWEMWDEGNALVRFRGVERGEVIDCTFGPSGGTGMRLDLHARYNRVTGCRFHDLGGTAVFLGGYGAGLKDVNGCNEVTGNLIQDCGQQFWHAAGILIHQSGDNRIAHNEIHNLPYSGIVLAGIRPGFLRSQVRDAVRDGRSEFDRSFVPIKENMRTQSLREICTHVRWDEVTLMDDLSPDDEMTASLPFIHTRRNVVEFNEICGVMEVLADGNGIYISDCGSYNVIRFNRIHHMTHAFGVGIRTDAFQRDTLVEGNIIHDCRGGLAVSRNNLAWNNVIAFMRSTGLDGETEGEADREVFSPIYYHVDRADGFHDGVLQRNICFHAGSRPLAFNLEKVSADSSIPRQLVDWNLFSWPEHPERLDELLAQLRSLGFDAHSAVGDPGFVNAQGRDFRLRPDAPARRLGIRSLPQEQMGRRSVGEGDSSRGKVSPNQQGISNEQE